MCWSLLLIVFFGMGGIVPSECRCEIMAVDLESSVRCCCLYFFVKIRFETNREVGPRDVDRLLQA
jgi:hypothetical protein